MQVIKRITMISSTVAIAFVFAGCGESKVAQCNKITKVANQAVTLGQDLGKNTNQQKGSKVLTEVAAKIDTISTEMKGLEIKDEKLQGFQSRFLSLYGNTSKSFKDAASAIDKKNLKGTNAALLNLKNNSSEETKLVNEINTYCSGK
ncbi:hypothetical protein NIES22_26640 [Calothrix brevissima NIES-22]|nr:hypothetical protein NIES22_26640 [Calothrix brevissima NIES-22]